MQAPRIPVNEAQRLSALHAMDMLDTPAEERFDRITRLASEILEAPIALVTLVSNQRQWFKSSVGLGVAETPREVSFCGHAILDEETFEVENAIEDPRFYDNPLVTGGPNIRFYAGHPLHSVDGDRVGTFCIIDQAPRKLTPKQTRILKDLAAIAESELQRGQLNEVQRVLIREMEELRRKAAIDGLTRLWNRTAIMELMKAEFERAKRGIPVCVAMIDIDHFKQVNDTYGHPAGDAVLAEVASRIRGALREYDSVGRYGGEEFIAVLSNCRPATGETLCQRMRKSIEKAEIPTAAGIVRATVSIGLASSGSNPDNLERLIGAADEALYRAKRNGRNQVELAEAASA